MTKPASPIHTVTVNVVHENRWYQVEDNAVEFPNGSKGHYFRVETKEPYKNAVVVLPVFPDKSIALIRQFQYGIGAWTINVPKGFGKPAMTAKQTAIAELSEETGLVAKTLIERGRFLADPGLYTTAPTSFVALGCVQKKDASPETSEVIAKKLIVIPYHRLNELLKNRSIPKDIELYDDKGHKLTKAADRRIEDMMTINTLQDFLLYGHDMMAARKPKAPPAKVIRRDADLFSQKNG